MSSRRKRKLRDKTESNSKRIKLDVNTNSSQWQCQQCTLLNDFDLIRCSVCNGRRSRHSNKNQQNNNKIISPKKKKRKEKIKENKSFMKMIFEALSNESMSERDQRNGLTQSNIINYIKQKITFNEITKVLIISSIEDAKKRGVLQKGSTNGRYKITHLGKKECKKKCKKKYDINNMTQEEKNKQTLKNELKTKYNEKYYDKKYCKFDDELTDNIINEMNVETLKKNLKYRGIKVGGNKWELQKRLECYLNDKNCVKSKTFEELKNNLKNTNINKFESKYAQRKKRTEEQKRKEIQALKDETYTQNLYDTLIEINDKFMDVKVSNDIWKFIAMYADGIASKCNNCSNEIHISVPFKINELIDDKYYIFDRYYYCEPYSWNKTCFKLNGRVYCAMCYDSLICNGCHGLVHPNDWLYCTDYDGCIVCKRSYCNKCESDYKMSRSYNGWCFRAGAPCCNKCLENLSDEDKEW